MPARKTAVVPAIDRVREIAFQLWLDAGQPDGQDTEHWFEAETLAANEVTRTPARKALPRKKAA